MCWRRGSEVRLSRPRKSWRQCGSRRQSSKPVIVRAEKRRALSMAADLQDTPFHGVPSPEPQSVRALT